AWHAVERSAAPGGGRLGARRQEAHAEIVAQRVARGRVLELRRRLRSATAARRHLWLSRSRYGLRSRPIQRPVIPRCAQTMRSGMRTSAAPHRNTELFNAQVIGSWL